MKNPRVRMVSGSVRNTRTGRTNAFKIPMRRLAMNNAGAFRIVMPSKI
jgi:hypothetical protein